MATKKYPHVIVDNWQQLLMDPFSPEEIGFKPKGKQPYNGKMLAFCYVDARSVMERLDLVIGSENWATEFENFENGSVRCKLSLRVGPQVGIEAITASSSIPQIHRDLCRTWCSKQDVGTPAGMDTDTKVKGAHSDAFKRAAVHWGIGRYLYWMDAMWVPYDTDKKKFTDNGLLAARRAFPDFAKPKLIQNGKVLPPVTEEEDDATPSSAAEPAAQPSQGQPPQPTSSATAHQAEQLQSQPNKTQIEKFDMFIDNMNNCKNEQQLASFWRMVNGEIANKIFTRQQVFDLESHKDGCKAKLAAALKNQ